MNLAWWMKSPSPFSIFFYLLLIAYGYTRLPPSETKFRHLTKLTDLFFIVGLPVLICDLQWVIVCLFRFGMVYPDSVLQLVLCAFRDLIGALLCYAMIHKHFDTGTLKFTGKTWTFLILNLAFLMVWFALSPNPAFTDWTYAIQHNYPFQIILQSFLTSHLLGRIFVALTFTSLFERGKILNTTNSIKVDGD